MANLRILDARGRSAGVLAGWPGARLAAEPPNPQHSLLTRARASLPFGGGDAAEPAGGDASAPSATLAQTLRPLWAMLVNGSCLWSRDQRVRRLVPFRVTP